MSSDGTAVPPVELTPLDFSAPQQVSAAPTTICTNCSRPIESVYYEVNGHVVCAPCRGKLSATIATAGKGGRLARAAGLGFLAAIVGAAVYFAIFAATGYEIGLISILVGWGVGRGVFIGSGKRGGRGYQLLAIGLTYLAISMAYLLIAKNTKDDATDTALQADSVAVTAASPAAVVSADSTATAGAPAGAKAKGGATTKSHNGIAKVMVSLFVLVALPVLVGFGSPISLLIMAFGMMQAWRMNKRIEIAVTGPYRLGGAPALSSEG